MSVPYRVTRLNHSAHAGPRPPPEHRERHRAGQRRHCRTARFLVAGHAEAGGVASDHLIPRLSRL